MNTPDLGLLTITKPHHIITIQLGATAAVLTIRHKTAGPPLPIVEYTLRNGSPWAIRNGYPQHPIHAYELNSSAKNVYNIPLWTLNLALDSTIKPLLRLTLHHALPDLTDILFTTTITPNKTQLKTLAELERYIQQSKATK